MPAGEIVVSLLASTGSFDTSIDRSTKAAEKRMRETQRTMETAGAAVGLAMGAAAVAAVAWGKNVISGLDAFNDLSDATGASIENISALEDIARRTGGTFDTVSAALIKFNMGLKEPDPNSPAALALKQIELNAADLRKMDPAEALMKTAQALSKFADDGDKARLVQELFGKSTKEVAALLKDMADNGTLVATVTTEQAKAAEAFNQQLSAMSKNSADLSRSIMGDLLPSLNAWATVLKEGGILAFLGLGGAQVGDPGAALQVVTDKLATMKKMRDELDPSKGVANKLNDWIFGDVGDLNKQIKVLEAEERALKKLQATAALSGLGDTSDAFSRRMGGKASVGPPTKKPEKGKDPDADFKRYLANLQLQGDKLSELTLSEKLLGDVERGRITGALSLTTKQLDVLTQEAALQDARIQHEGDLTAHVQQRRQALLDEYDAQKKVADEAEALFQRLVDGGPAAQLEKQRNEMQVLADAFLAGRINADKFNDAVTGALNLVAEKAPEAKSAMEDLGSIGLDALHSLAVGGGKVGDVFKSMAMRVADLVFQLGVAEPAMKALREAMGSSGGASSGGGMWGSLLSAAASALAGGGSGGGSYDIGANYSGFRADGGPVAAGGSYIVGERGPEMFVPRTAGMVVPNNAMAGSGNISVINQTTGRIDSVVEQRISPTERALILQENQKLTAAQLANQNSPLSQAMRRNFNVMPSRS